MNKDNLIEEVQEGSTLARALGFIISSIAFLIILNSSPPEGLSLEGWRTFAVGTLMAGFWITEAIPIPATALLPLVLFPILRISNLKESAREYANPMVYLYLGGFVLAMGMEKWNLHRRIALNIIKIVGTKPHNIVAGFLISTSFISMWTSNAATAIMMIPMTVSVLELMKNKMKSDNHAEFRNFAICLMLSIAYGASIGGLGTLIGTPPNIFMKGFLSERYQKEISFGEWMLIGVPLVVVSLPIVYVLLTKIVFKLKSDSFDVGKEIIDEEIRQIGKISKEEILVAIVFGTTVIFWMSQEIIMNYVYQYYLSHPEFIKLNEKCMKDSATQIDCIKKYFSLDTLIAMVGAISLFLIPRNFKKGEFLMDWKSLGKMPWDVLILYGGGLSLAGAITDTKLAEWLGSKGEILRGMPVPVIVIIITTIVIFMTELTSNLATVAALLPVIGPLAIGLGQDPILFVVPATLAASCAFMLPVGTPPNAIVFASGHIKIRDMMRAGIWMNLIFIFLIVIITYLIGKPLLGR